MLLSAPLAQHAESGFLPHGYCYLWNKPLLFTHVTSDVLIGASYVAISFSLALMLRRLKGDLPFSPIFVAFGLFIVACGLTHFVEVWTLWNPVYWLAGGVKAVTAVASVSTAAVLPFVIPMVGRTIREARSAEAQRIASARETAQRESHALLTAVLEAAAEPVYF